MRTPREIYAAYKIMPNLQMHQLRVAAVAKMICDNISPPIDTKSVVLAALFHDMGNIIKFDLGRFPEFLEPEGLEYWTAVQNEYFEKYGREQHAASAAIGREVGLSDGVIDLIVNVAFSEMVSTRDSDSYEKKVTEYADMRVSPFGVTSMQERLDEGHVRYAARRNKDWTEERYTTLLKAAFDIEAQIFSRCSIRPADITDTAVAPIIEQLWEYPVS